MNTILARTLIPRSQRVFSADWFIHKGFSSAQYSNLGWEMSFNLACMSMYRIPPEVEGQGGVVSLTLTQLEVVLFGQVLQCVLDQNTVQQLTQVQHLHRPQGNIILNISRDQIRLRNTITAYYFDRVAWWHCIHLRASKICQLRSLHQIPQILA